MSTIVEFLLAAGFFLIGAAMALVGLVAVKLMWAAAQWLDRKDRPIGHR